MKLKIWTAPILFLTILTTYPAFGQQSQSFDVARSSDIMDRQPGSVMDLLPELDTLNCTPKCEGTNSCSQHKDIDSCLADKSNKNGCFWSCE